MRFIYTKTFAKIFTTFVVIALFIVLNATGYINWLKNDFLHGYGFFAQRVESVSLGVKNGFQTVFTIKNLAHDNALLNQQVDQLAFENAQLQSAQTENIALRQALTLKQKSKFNLLAVAVLTSDPTGFSQELTIDHGQNSGLAVGMPVVVAPGLLVGKITAVYASSAEVTMITDPDSTANAEVVASGAKGIVRGEHGLSLLFDLVTQNEVIKSGDPVVTSGLSGDYPAGILIGQITALKSQPTDLFQQAYITPAADLRNLNFLFVILPQ